MNEQKLKEVESAIDEYWDADFVEVDSANKVADHAWKLMCEVRRLQEIIKEADSEASLRGNDSFDKINEILAKVNIND